MSDFSQNHGDDRKHRMTITKLGRYDIVRVLGKGAMGMVYEARDPNLDRRVAIKTIKVENLSAEASSDYEARFRTEARSAARLQHPNIVSVYDSERHGDTAYLVMEYVQGDDLKQHLDGGKRYSLEQSLGIVRDLLSALDYAHRQNIVHRDVKPANLLVEASGRVKLTDFGVARIQDSGEATRTKGSMVGTLKYMSPEQVQGLAVDARSDLFAAGIVLYQLLTGKRPFDGEGEFAIIHQIVSQQPAAPSSINPQLPVALDAVVARALAKQREDRFASAQEFAQALQEASGHAPDPTIVPPFSSADQRSGGTGSGGLRSRGGSASGSVRSGEGSGATVTQELELVYWKDIRESDDPADLRGFLDRFPAGIYADLARRRLRKLEGSESSDPSSTRTAIVAPATAAEPQAGDGTAGVPGDSEATLVSPRPDVSDATLVSPAVPEGGAQDAPAPRADPAPVSPPAEAPRPKGAKLVMGVAGLVAAAGLVYMMRSGSPPEGGEANLPQSGASAPVATPAALAVAPAASVALAAPSEALPTALAGPGSPASVASKAGPAASSRVAALPRNAVSAASAAAVPATGMAAPAAPAATAAPASPVASAAQVTRPPAPKSPAEPKPSQALSGPAQACEGKVLLSYQLCLTEQCATAAFSKLPFCVERSANERAARARQGADNR